MSKMKFASPLEGADGASEGFNRVDNIEWHKQNRSKCCSEELLANEFRGLMFILGLKEKKVKISLLHVIKSLAQNLVIVTILLLLFILRQCNFFPNPLSGYPKKLKKIKTVLCSCYRPIAAITGFSPLNVITMQRSPMGSFGIGSFFSRD